MRFVNLPMEFLLKYETVYVDNYKFLTTTFFKFWRVRRSFKSSITQHDHLLVILYPCLFRTHLFGIQMQFIQTKVKAHSYPNAGPFVPKPLIDSYPPNIHIFKGAFFNVLDIGPQPLKLYGLLKLHKPGFLMRPIVSFCGSPTYQPSKYLTTILQILTNKSRHKLQSTKDFINATKTIQIPDDYKLVSFDVKSLFTSIPLQLALQCTETAIRQSTDPLLLPTEDIMDLLNLCLTSTYLSAMVNTTIGYMAQLWGLQFLLL